MGSRENEKRETGDRSSKTYKQLFQKVCFKEKERKGMLSGEFLRPRYIYIYRYIL